MSTAQQEQPVATFALTPLGAFSLEAASKFWGGFTPASHTRPDAEGHLHLAFAVEGSWRTAGVCVRHDDGRLSGRVFGDGDADSVARQTARILSLDVDGRQFPEVGRRDQVVADLQRRHPGLRPVCFYSPYEAAVWAIVSQRIQMRQAAAIKARLIETFGDLVDIHGQPMRAFPGPEKLADLQAFAGLSATKASQLRAIASAALAGELDWVYLRSRPETEALEALQRLPGIGPFSAELILLRGSTRVR